MILVILIWISLISYDFHDSPMDFFDLYDFYVSLMDFYDFFKKCDSLIALFDFMVGHDE